MVKERTAAGVVFLVILEDRHFDAMITVCRSLELADEIVQEHIDDEQPFAPKLTWRRDMYVEQRSPRWKRAWSCGDDGPKIRVEECGVYE